MFLVLDVETGGIAKETSLLTAWFGVYDEKFNLLDSLDLRLKPDNELYVVEAQGMAVNKIDLVSHDKVARTYKQAKPILYDFLQRNYHRAKDVLTPVGHGVQFDIAKVTENLISLGSWEHFCSYRTLDTSVIANFLRMAGVLPKELEAGLGKLRDYYKIVVEGNAHEAEYDAKVTVEVLQYLLKEVEKK